MTRRIPKWTTANLLLPERVERICNDCHKRFETRVGPMVRCEACTQRRVNRAERM